MNEKEHVPRYVSDRGHDQYTCSCGWSSDQFWSDVTAAYDAWLVHAYYNNVSVKERDQLRQDRAVMRDRVALEGRRK